jgi:uncharacterized protein involved in response to NO
MAQNRYETRKRVPRASDQVLGVRPIFLIAAALAVVAVAWVLWMLVGAGPPAVVR